MIPRNSNCNKRLVKNKYNFEKWQFGKGKFYLIIENGKKQIVVVVLKGYKQFIELYTILLGLCLL